MKKVIILMALCIFSIGISAVFSESGQYQNSNSPFGMSGALSRPFIESDKVKHEEVLRRIHEKKEPYKEAQDIGVKWIRPNSDIYWRAVQRRLEDVIDGHFDWESIDDLHGRVPPGIGIFGTIDPLLWGVNKDPAFKPGTWEFASPQEERNYLRFVRETVERYDGDGYKDMPGLKNPIKYWQIGNEPAGRPLFGIRERNLSKELINKEWDWRGFSHIVEITYKAIKESDPDTKIALAGLASGHPNPDDPLVQVMTVPPDIRERQEFYIPILQNLHGKYIDVFDIHYYGALREKGPDSYQWLSLRDTYELIRRELDRNGYRGTEIWVTETAVPSVPFGERFQAINLLKRYVYALSLGVKKIFWWNMIEGEYPLEENKPSNHFGLIYDGVGPGDPGYGVKKLSYYTYKKMVEMLAGSDWDHIQTVQESDDVYIYKFSRDDAPIWVVWNDSSVEKKVTISGITANKVTITKTVPEYLSGKEIKDYLSAFAIEKVKVIHGKLNFLLGENPVFIELDKSDPLAADPITDWGNYEVNVRDGLINKTTAEAELPGIVDTIRQVCLKYNFTDNQLWIFPLKGYGLRSIADKDSDYKPDIVYGVSPLKGYNFFDGNRHGGHPAHDIFISDKDQNTLDDRTQRQVEAVAMVDCLALTTFTQWRPDTKLRGGNYIWLYNPKIEMFFYYAHLDTVSVKPGDFVTAGTVLGTVGRTGLLAHKKTNPTHLHLMVLHYQDGVLEPFEYYQELRHGRQ